MGAADLATRFTGTRPAEGPQAFDAERLAAWLRAHVPGVPPGPLAVSRFRGGQSNPTFLLQAGDARWVLRRKPAGALLPSAHAVDREFAVQRALAGSGVPVPHVHALCEDDAVIGSAFYVMSHVEGRVLWDGALPGLPRAERAAMYDDMNRVLSRLHALDPAEVGLAAFGRAGGYFARQVARWVAQSRATAAPPLPDLDRLAAWLPDHLPEGADADTTAIVHGDYRLDNLVFHPSEPRIVAVLDWELATLGHPLADAAYHLLSWLLPPGDLRGLAGLDLAGLGIPDADRYLRTYASRAGRGDVDPRTWRFCLAFTLFRGAAILQSILGRVAAGTAASEDAARTGRGAPVLAALGWRIAQGAPIHDLLEGLPSP